MALVLSLDNPSFRAYIFYASIVILKLLFLSVLTAAQRIVKGVFGTPEDYKTFGNKVPAKPIIDEGIERVRKNHLNDLENIPVFLVAGLLYLFVNPTPTAALWHFRLFGWSRVAHTVSYQLGKQPWRVIFYTIGLCSTVSMLIVTLRAVW